MTPGCRATSWPCLSAAVRHVVRRPCPRRRLGSTVINQPDGRSGAQSGPGGGGGYEPTPWSARGLQLQARPNPAGWAQPNRNQHSALPIFGARVSPEEDCRTDVTVVCSSCLTLRRSSSLLHLGVVDALPAPSRRPAQPPNPLSPAPLRGRQLVKARERQARSTGGLAGTKEKSRSVPTSSINDAR